MKKLLALMVAILFSVTVYAQDKEKKMDKMHASMKDCVMMHDGKMMVMKGGEMTAMTEDMTLKNGTMGGRPHSYEMFHQGSIIRESLP